MSISARTVWEIRTTGNDLNGGGFVSGSSGTDYSQQNSKNTVGNDISTTDVVATGSTTITSATATFTAAVVGNIIYLQGGTGVLAAGWYQVISRTNATQIVLDRTVAAGTGITMNIGGAMASLGGACLGSAPISGQTNTYWIKAGTYIQTTNTVNVSGGKAQGISQKIIGYNNTRGDYGTRPILQINTGLTGATCLTAFVGNGVNFSNLILDGNGQTSSSGVAIGGSTDVTLYRIECRNMRSVAFNLTDGIIVQCVATGGAVSAGFNGGGRYINCIAYNNAAPGFNSSVNRVSYIGCISYGNTGAGAHGFGSIARDSLIVNCIAYGNAGDGFITGVQNSNFQNCIAESNAGNGFNLSNSGNGSGDAPTNIIQNCAAFGNATNFNINTNGAYLQIGNITGVSSFFTNAAAGDFSLNNTVGAGAACRAAGYPGVMPLGLTTGYTDIGIQHQDTGGGGSVPATSIYFG